MGLVGIYKITNPEGKIYIGYSTDLQRREAQYSINNIPTQKLLKESIIKYRWNNHTFDILEYCSLDELKIREKYWIEFYKSYQNGLNLNKGGGGPLNHSEETKKKMSKPKPEGFGKVISDIKKGKLNPKLSLFKKNKPSFFTDHKHTPETKQIMSQHRSGKTYKEIFGEAEGKIQKHNKSLPRKGKDIKCINNGVIYPSVKEASLNLNVSERSISNILTRLALKTKSGLKFIYAN
jgi:group I intron endonuclease